MLIGLIVGVLAGYMIAILHGFIAIGKDKRKEIKDKIKEIID